MCLVVHSRVYFLVCLFKVSLCSLADLDFTEIHLPQCWIKDVRQHICHTVYFHRLNLSSVRSTRLWHFSGAKYFLWLCTSIEY